MVLLVVIVSVGVDLCAMLASVSSPHHPHHHHHIRHLNYLNNTLHLIYIAHVNSVLAGHRVYGYNTTHGHHS